MVTNRRAFIVEDSGVGRAPKGPVVRFELVSEMEGVSITQHLGTYPTTSMESFREIPLAPYSEAIPIGVYAIIEGGDRVRDGERIDVVGGRFALGALAARAEVRPRWAGSIRPHGFVDQLQLRGPPLPTTAHVE